MVITLTVIATHGIVAARKTVSAQLDRAISEDFLRQTVNGIDLCSTVFTQWRVQYMGLFYFAASIGE